MNHDGRDTFCNLQRDGVERLMVEPGLTELIPDYEAMVGCVIVPVEGDTNATYAPPRELLDLPCVKPPKLGKSFNVITDRNNIKKLMGLAHGEFGIHVQVYTEKRAFVLGIGHKDAAGEWKPSHKVGDRSKPYGNGFEKLMTSGAYNPYIGVHCYTKMVLPAVTVVMRCEIDCLDHGANKKEGTVSFVELKHGKEYGDKQNDNWCWPYFQMLLGDVDTLIKGYYEEADGERVLTRFVKLTRNDVWELHAKNRRDDMADWESNNALNTVDEILAKLYHAWRKYGNDFWLIGGTKSFRVQYVDIYKTGEFIKLGELYKVRERRQ